MEDAAKKMEGFLANSKTKTDTEMLNKANAAREKAYEIVKNSAEFMHTFNDLYDKLKPALFNEDHVKVANAIIKLNDIRPHELIKEAGILKRIRTIKLDSEFIKSVLKWVNAIVGIYEMLDEAGKMLGKSDKQIEGARKQAASQRMRWGM
jgi:hypothetical protein